MRKPSRKEKAKKRKSFKRNKKVTRTEFKDYRAISFMAGPVNIPTVDGRAKYNPSKKPFKVKDKEINKRGILGRLANSVKRVFNTK